MPLPDYKEYPTIEVVRSVKELNNAGYLKANPDVKAAGLTARDHFLRYGKNEGRRQFVNETAIKKLRREKLGSVLFRSGTRVQASQSGVLNYLSEEVKSSFEIPDTPPAAANEYNDEIVDIIRAHPDHLFLDVGAGFRHTYYSNVVNAEIWASESTDVICIGESLPFSDAQFDHVFCLAVLEHTKQPWVAVQEIVRVTKPGGVIRIDWPFLQPVHGYPHHYFNATPKATRVQFEGDCDIISCEVRPWQHPIYALSWMLEEWKDGLPEADRPAFYDLKIGSLIGSIPHRTHLASLPFCTKLNSQAQAVIATGTTLIARKR